MACQRKQMRYILSHLESKYNIGGKEVDRKMVIIYNSQFTDKEKLGDCILWEINVLNVDWKTLISMGS